MANSGSSAKSVIQHSSTGPTRTAAEPRAEGADFWAVFEYAPDAYLLLAPDAPRFTMVAANEARLRVTLTRREDVVGRPLFDVFPDNPADPAATGVRNLQASLAEVLRTRRPHRMALQQYDIRKPDGTFEERYWDPLNSPVFDSRGELVYIIHRVEDVTEQVRSGERLRVLEKAVNTETHARQRVEGVLERLRESEQRYRVLIDMIPQNVWAADARGNHTFFSRRWYEYTGASVDESRGEAWLQYIHPDDRERTVSRWNRSVKTGEPYEIEYRFRGADGDYRWFLGQAAPLRDERGEITEWFGTATDISDRKRLDETRERMLEHEREAREQVTAILESITDAFFALDRDWCFEYVNGEAERLLARPRDQLIGRSVSGEFGAAVDSPFEREYRRAVEEQVTVSFEAFYSPLGIWFDVRAYPSSEGLSVFFRDVTRRKRAEERLRESEERYRLLADMIPQHIWTADPDGYHSYFSRRWYEFTGASQDETQGEGWMKFLHPDDRRRTIEAWDESRSTGQRYSIEYRFRRHTGEYCWFWGQAVPQRNEDGTIVRWVGTLTDISDRKHADEERERLLASERQARADADRRHAEVERITESRTRLMRGFTHDVKNPLGAADGYAQLLEDGILGELSDKQRDSVARMRKAIHTSLNLINELLELARAEAGQLELELVDVDVAALAREAVDDFQAQANAAGLALAVRAPDKLLVRTDPKRARQVLSNLLSNAVKYTPHGSVTVEAMRRDDDACAAITVTDTGPGIPEAKRESIFQEFTRLDPAARQGAGVGLAISRRIARMLGGDITVASAVGQGSSFTLSLPCAADENGPR